MAAGRETYDGNDAKDLGDDAYSNPLKRVRLTALRLS